MLVVVVAASVGINSVGGPKRIVELLEMTIGDREVDKVTSSSGEGTVDSLEIDKFMDFLIPIPPIAEQERIIAILTRFDDLCNNLSIGLPAEIDARRKQYEYYRDKLLTFKEVKA